MSNGELIFRNFRGNVIRREDSFSGILYCGRKYTSFKGCACLDCDGSCEPGSGCACPECDYTLAYILYCTGQMYCPLCKSMLLRLNIFNLKKLNDLNDNISVLCNECNNAYNYNCLPIMHCRSTLEGEGIFYCGKNYVFPNKCICSSCDGQCGPYIS